MIERRTNHIGILERMGIFLAARLQPLHQIAHRAHITRHIQIFLGLADALAHPCKIKNLHV